MSTEVTRLQVAMRTRTISHLDRSLIDTTQLEALYHILRTNYPMLIKTTECMVIGNHSLILLIESDHSKQLPYATMGHIDVVPVFAWNTSKKRASFDFALDEVGVFADGRRMGIDSQKSCLSSDYRLI